MGKKLKEVRFDPLKQLEDRIFRDEQLDREIIAVINTIIDTLEEGDLDLFKNKIFTNELRRKIRW